MHLHITKNESTEWKVLDNFEYQILTLQNQEVSDEK